jgi:hypothetical protein
MAKSRTYSNRNVNLERLAQHIRFYLQENSFQIAVSGGGASNLSQTHPSSSFLIQAIKKSALRSLTGTRRSTDIVIEGNPDDFTISVGTGEWGENLVTSAPLMIFPPVGIAATLAKLYLGKRFGDNLWQFIEEQINQLSNKDMDKADVFEVPYSVKYIQGYPGWNEEIDGQLVLHKGNLEHKIIFRVRNDERKEIHMPAAQVGSAEIISSHENNLMIQLVCQDDSGIFISPVFDAGDDIVSGILYGINDLVNESRSLLLPSGKDHIGTADYGSSSSPLSYDSYSEDQGESTSKDTPSQSDVLVCYGCGKPVEETANYCPNCGFKLL